MLFLHGKDYYLNIRAAFRPMTVDAGALAGTWRLFRQSVQVIFNGVPFTINPQSVRQYLESLPGVNQSSALTGN